MFEELSKNSETERLAVIKDLKMKNVCTKMAPKDLSYELKLWAENVTTPSSKTVGRNRYFERKS